MTPKEVWAALKEKGVTERSIADGAYNSQENKAKAASKPVNERRKDLVKKYSDEPEKDIKALEQPGKWLSKAEYAKVSKAIAEKYATAVRNKQTIYNFVNSFSPFDSNYLNNYYTTPHNMSFSTQPTDEFWEPYFGDYYNIIIPYTIRSGNHGSYLAVIITNFQTGEEVFSKSIQYWNGDTSVRAEGWYV